MFLEEEIIKACLGKDPAKLLVTWNIAPLSHHKLADIETGDAILYVPGGT